ncbi:hypothetical protein BV509_12325 [Rhodovulum sulfidophilum]|uniref:Phage gp6-like head-tail connector protein n=1 Tax=Rhodovulum visakhapatnamense TaxID=364297 RepID=A0ABS1RLL8_9RHOB|nr:phage gp6-like head-tail connector protein [Rhodovulum visakhapatnamense]MBL3571968.1 phage gp6-like head-tail connector protein [Rhodovulum visakhapatnamense]MBL3580553.1 phage gp6-like head-tail connector protein [Rhodovulum visakhapatnamense]OLS45045.1 hypothetical protein BV509_12325 [Rhodovulum sulfidophilum]
MILAEIPPLGVSVEAYKRASHWEGDADNSRIEACLAAAQSAVETATRRPLTPRRVRFETAAGQGRRWWVPVAPVREILGIGWSAPDGTTGDLGADAAWLLFAECEPQILFAEGALAAVPEGSPLAITLSVGPDIVPPVLAQAVILIARDWLEAGIAIETVESPRIAFGARALIRQMRYRRPTSWCRR